MFPVQAAWAGVNSIAGTSEVRVSQYQNSQLVQTDFNFEGLPETKLEPPLVARGRLDRLLSPNEVIAAGQGVAIMYAPNLTGFGNPSDVGIDIGAFTDGADTTTSWITTATVSQRRNITLSPAEIGEQSLLATTGQVRSRVLLSGVMLITSESTSKDLTGLDVGLIFNVIRRQAGREDTVPAAGEIALVGGPNGAVTVQRRAGALNNVTIPVADLNAVVPDAPLVKAILFQGVEFPYEYDFNFNEPFELELKVTATIMTQPGGVGALATFGTPAEGLGAILDRVKQNDSGKKLIAAINERVDTTGEAYLNQPVGLPGFGNLCGTSGASLMPLLVIGCGIGAARRRQRAGR